MRYWWLNMNRKNVLIGFSIIIVLLLFVSLDYLINLNINDDPTERKKEGEQNLQENLLSLSEEIFYEDDKFVFYTDRIIERFNYKEENIYNISLAWKNLSREFPDNVNAFIVPIPTRIIFENGYDGDKYEYDQFYNKLAEIFMGRASVVDLRNILDFHKDEYIFNRTTDSITARGGYYASKEIGNAMGLDFYIPLTEYQEHMYRVHTGINDYLQKVGFEENTEEYELLMNIPEDLSYYYLFHDSKNVCEVFVFDENSAITSRKQPTLLKSGTGGGSMISGKKFEWAVAEGDSKSTDKGDKTLLLIGDTSGRYILPYLSNYYEKIYYINLNWNSVLGSQFQQVKKIFEDYDIDDVVYAQIAQNFGDSSYGIAMKRYIF